MIDIDVASADSFDDPLIDKTVHFVEYLSEAITDEFWHMWTEYNRKRAGDPRITQHIYDCGLSVPCFTVADHIQAVNLLSELGFEDTIMEPEKALMIFKLPKVLDSFWKKGPFSREGLTIKLPEPHVIEWGFFYRHLRDIVWDEIKSEEGLGALAFERVNPKRVHKPGKYYYIFKVREWRERAIQ